MNIKMTIQEKDQTLAQIIQEQFLKQKTNLTYIPVQQLKNNGLDRYDCLATLERLKDQGSIKRYKHGYGSFETEDAIKKFIFTTKENMRGFDEEIYEVEVIPKKLIIKETPSQPEKKGNNTLCLYLKKNGVLYREPQEAFFHNMEPNALPVKILQYFATNQNRMFKKDTKALAKDLEIKADRLRREVNKLVPKIKIKLKIEIGIIEGKRKQGYRLIPEVEITLKD